MARPYTPDTLAAAWVIAILRVYIDGYRPADWPVKPMEGC